MKLNLNSIFFSTQAYRFTKHDTIHSALLRHFVTKQVFLNVIVQSLVKKRNRNVIAGETNPKSDPQTRPTGLKRFKKRYFCQILNISGLPKVILKTLKIQFKALRFLGYVIFYIIQDISYIPDIIRIIIRIRMFHVLNINLT